MGDGYDSPGPLRYPRSYTLGTGGRFRLPSLDLPPPAPYLPTFDQDFHLPPLAEPDAPQMGMPTLGVTNSAWMQQNPLYTLTTEFTSLLPFMSETTPGVGTTPGEGATFRPSLMVGVRDRLWQHGEFGVFGGFGGKLPFGAGRPTGNGILGLSLHLGPDAPEGDATRYGTGVWLTLAQAWGAEPDRETPPPGWSFNPTGGVMVSHSWQHPDEWGADLVWGANASRWGAVNDVPVGGFLNPYLGFNYARSLGKHDTLNWEATVGLNLGLAGRYDVLPGPRVPASLAVNVGLFGWQHTWGDYGFGIEPWFFAEPWSNVANSGASFYNYGGGLRLDFGAINPRRAHVDDEFGR